MQVAPSDSERARAFRFPPIALPEGAQYECALEAFDLIFIGLVEGQILSDGDRHWLLTLRPRRTHGRRQVVNIHGSTVRERFPALDYVFQLTNISRPLVIFQRFQSLLREISGSFLKLMRGLF